MVRINDVYSLTEFQRNAREHCKRLRRSGRPNLLTVNGKAEIVVQDAESYQRLLDELDRAEAVAGIREGLADVRAGRFEPADQAMKKIRARLTKRRAR